LGAKSTNTRAADRLARCDRAQLDHLQDHHRKQSGRPPGRDGPAESSAAVGARSAVNHRQRLTTTQPAASADAAEARTDPHLLGKGLSRVPRQHVAVQYHDERCPDAADCCGSKMLRMQMGQLTQQCAHPQQQNWGMRSIHGMGGHAGRGTRLGIAGAQPVTLVTPLGKVIEHRDRY
jgi:hypothetical protein